MGRNKGTFQFPSNFEVLTKAPLDARLLVSKKDDLTNSTTWLDSNNNIWLYKGMTVSVIDDPSTSNNGLYFLINDASYNYDDSWLKINKIETTDVSGTNYVSFQINRDENGVILKDSSGNLDLLTVTPGIWANLRAGDLTIDNLKLDNLNGVLYATDGSVLSIDDSKVLLGYNGIINANGVTNVFIIDHSLGTTNQVITVYEGNQVIYPDIIRGTQTDVLNFSYPPPASPQLEVVILGFNI